MTTKLSREFQLITFLPVQKAWHLLSVTAKGRLSFSKQLYMAKENLRRKCSIHCIKGFSLLTHKLIKVAL